MKKQLLLLIGCLLIVASCGSSNNNEQTEQAKIDSVAKANAALQDIINQKKNDSTINAMAAAKADSIGKAEAVAKQHEKPAAGKTTTGAAPQPAGNAQSDQSKSK